jgi:hypothetical protein
MMFSSQAFRFAILLTAAFNDVTCSAQTVLDSDLVVDGNTPAPIAVGLGQAGNFVILTKAGISTVPGSVITGNIAVSPIAATAMTGFSLTADSTNAFSTSAQLPGYKAFAADYAVPTPADLTTSVLNMEAAYTDAAGRTRRDPDKLNYGDGILGSNANSPGGSDFPLAGGVYTWDNDGGNVIVSGGLYFTGSATDIFILQITGDLDLLTGAEVFLLDNIKAENIFWQVAGRVKVGLGAKMKGIVLAKTAVLFETGSSLHGRILCQTHAALQVATVAEP